LFRRHEEAPTPVARLAAASYAKAAKAEQQV
jgi:hypothetical protein